VCGHELTSELNFVERATTAAMNAKLIPMIESLIDAVEQALNKRGLQNVKIMVVKGDGSQLLADVARQVPVETVLSGPAASVVGAARLQTHSNAIVADMGGTTLDVAVLRDGAPVLSDQGARIGGFRTSVRAMAAETIGLGGDSEIDLSDWPQVHIGPRRVTPFCRIAALGPDAANRLREQVPDAVSRARHCTDMVALAPGTVPRDDRVLSQLSGGPLLLGTLARRMNRAFPDHIPWRDLESRGAIVRCGLTLTDILHLRGSFAKFDPAPPRDVLTRWASLLEVSCDEIIDAVLHEFRRLVCDTLMTVALPANCPWDDAGPFRQWLTAHLTGTGAGEDRTCGMTFRLAHPLVGVGAPVAALFPALQPYIHQDVVISEYAGVANAVGAIAGDVLLRHVAAIRARDDGALVCSWRGSNYRANSLEDALGTCEKALATLLEADAEANAIPPSTPQFSVVRHQADTRDGPVFLGLTLLGEIKG
jgi:predicted RNase H-like HicB family nuclease